MVLLLCAVALLGRRRREAVTAVLGLTVVGGCVLVLFEVWPRYLHWYAPLFVVLAAVGLDSLQYGLKGGVRSPEKAA